MNHHAFIKTKVGMAKTRKNNLGLSYIRTIYGLSMQDLANVIGVSKQTINKWEKNITPISSKRLNQLYEIFKLDKDLFTKEITNDDKVLILENEIKRLKSN